MVVHGRLLKCIPQTAKYLKLGATSTINIREIGSCGLAHQLKVERWRGSSLNCKRPQADPLGSKISANGVDSGD